MALIFKIKFQDTLRRWVVTDRLIEADNLPSLQQLEAKIRDLFQLPSSTAIVITYIDKEEDVVTLAEDQDLVDACIGQGVNPLRLEVKSLKESEVREELPNAPVPSPSAESPPRDLNVETFLKGIFPQATADAINQFLTKLPQVDPKLPAALLLRNAQKAFNEFLKTLTRDSVCAKRWADLSSSGNANRNPYEHPHAGQSYPQRFAPGGRGASASPLHGGIQCDGCGMSPIEGLRFKSKKIHDYDLCSSCFETMGNETDYEKIDRPVYYPHYGFHNYSHPGRGACVPDLSCSEERVLQFKPHYGFHNHSHPGAGRWQHMGFPFRPFFARGPYGWKPESSFRMPPENIFAPGGAVSGKLDARFVKDVTVLDGTELAPSTKFTKIWRLSNTGTIPWPQNTQLVHIGGDMLSSEEVVNLELPEGGLPCGEEVEASAELVAPEKAGRYVSHWRLASPFGQKFGHKVWAVIQVVPQGEQSPQLYESLRGEELTQEVEQAKMSTEKGTEEKGIEVSASDSKGKEKMVSLQHREAMIPETVVLDSGKRVDVEIAENTDNEELNMKVPDQRNNMDNCTDQAFVTDDLANPNGFKGTVNSDELDGFSVVEKPVENTEWEDVTEAKRDHEKHLQLLERMGYTDREFNVELLQKNNQNLELTVEDLVATAGWDDMLNDLQEMGFFDRQTNRQLLRKNQGSIKRVVRDLVQMEKQKVGENRKDAEAREANKV